MRFRTMAPTIIVRGDDLLDSDAVFWVKESLVMDFKHPAPHSPTPDGRAVDGAWSRVAFHIVLAPAGI